MDCSALGKALRFCKVIYSEHSTPKMTIRCTSSDSHHAISRLLLWHIFCETTPYRTSGHSQTQRQIHITGSYYKTFGPKSRCTTWVRMTLLSVTHAQNLFWNLIWRIFILALSLTSHLNFWHLPSDFYFAILTSFSATLPDLTSGTDLACLLTLRRAIFWHLILVLQKVGGLIWYLTCHSFWPSCQTNFWHLTWNTLYVTISHMTAAIWNLQFVI